MSTHIGTIKGVREIASKATREVGYVDEELHVNSFWGGDKRGRCFQLTLSDGGYIQISTVGAMQLIEMLKGEL